MSDTASRKEIDDVLSSIRRLVSQRGEEGAETTAEASLAEPASPEAAPTAAPALVLTPSLRIAPEPEEELGFDARIDEIWQDESAEQSPADPEGDDLKGRIANLEAAMDAAEDEWEPDGSEAQNLPTELPQWQSVRSSTAVETSDDSVSWDVTAEDDAEQEDAEQNDAEREELAAQQELAEQEEPVEQEEAAEQTELAEQVEETEFTSHSDQLSDLAESAVAEQEVDQTETPNSEAEVIAAFLSQASDPLDNLEAPIDGHVAAPTTEPEEHFVFQSSYAGDAWPESFESDDNEIEVESRLHFVEQPVEEPNADAAFVSDHAPEPAISEPSENVERLETLPEYSASEIEGADEDDLFDGPLEAVLDEDWLRETVAGMIREELRGEMGEKISQSVRKLVRQEIMRALAARDLT